ncbi:hypothetical protein Kfla_0618 [Kribbella flavida DSM 17836]|uniref:Uncharacterized protein n=1 Tax=Kribbella flavida (strain DSM 17836 / JCM 10339 / NBRC 14399) TaxID=479435 RepID=D2PX91_KRIFD|nr:hypothetical protein [Kribbella flavida]ADB29739.1 hypothetical protein Kfla_0618 [Kribbella flavida DSM 17836]
MTRPLALLTALLSTATVLTAVATPPTAHAAISCDTDTTGGSTFYDGPSASRKYDARFSNSHSIPNLGTHTPQGAGTWYNWDGAGRNLLLVSSYRGGANAQIYGIDPATGATVGVVAIAESHVGGITTSKGWAFVSGGSGSVRKYRLSDLRTALKAAGTPYLAQVGTARAVTGSSFLTSYGDSLWSGTFNETGRGTMYEYKIADDGTLTTVAGAWEVPTKAQGLMVTANHFVYSTSYGRGNRSNLYVVRRGQRDLDAAALSCFRAPSMTEGITEYNGTAYLVYESGSHLYAGDPATLNVIPRMHKAAVTSLTSLVP